MFATTLLHGLPPSYRAFKEKYGWIPSTKPDDPPDLDYLYERLRVEELQQIRIKERKTVKEPKSPRAVTSAPKPTAADLSRAARIKPT